MKLPCNGQDGRRCARRARTRSNACGGFALLLTLTLLALVVALLLGAITLTRVESAVAANSQQAAQARAHAFLALQLAAGRLQRLAGPDQRVTARADLLPTSTGNPYWTGVWDAAARSGGPLTWLVSGNEVDPLACVPSTAPVADPGPDHDSVWLLRTPVSAAGQRIKLPRQPVRAAAGAGEEGTSTMGHYAWWVGDEGVKAKFNLVNPAAGAAPGSPDSLSQFLSAQQFGIEELAAGFAAYATAKGNTAAGAALRDRLSRVLTPNQVVYADPSFGVATLRDCFHDLTTYSFGVLADARNGGLRKDLTRGLEAGATVPAGAIFPGGPAWDLLRSYHRQRPDDVDGRWQIAPCAPEPAQLGVHPVVLLVQMTWGGDRVGGKFRLLLHPMIVLANPYDVTLLPADYRLVWKQTGAIELQMPSGESESATVSGRPPDLLGEDPQLLIPQAGFRPGEARVFTLPAAADGVAYEPGTGLTLADGYRSGVHAVRVLPVAAPDAALTMRVRVSTGANGFEFSLAASGRLQEVSDAAANAPDVTGSLPLLAAPVRLGLRLAQDSLNAPGDATGLRWLADFNVRAPVSGLFPAWGRNPLYNAATPREGGDNTVLNGAFTCWGPANRAADGGRQFVTLFHLPRADLHSLAQLRFANLQPSAAGPGYGVGQAYADPHTPDGTADFNYRLNDTLWDRFFFSTLPAGAGALPAALPNARIVLYRRRGTAAAPEVVHNYDTAAAHLLVDGPFNINSTSVAAWQAVLASLNAQRLAWNDPASGMESIVTVGRAFPPGPGVNGGEDDGWCGYRALSSAQLHGLAAALVSRLRAHGPFRSLAEFINRPLDAAQETERLAGVLQAAIDGVANPPPSLAPAPGLPEQAGPSAPLAWPAASQGYRATLAPGWLSQADVLGVLGPLLAVRSDTFLVRAYGDAVNPATGAIVSRAWCEAVVQRTPDYVDPADAPETTADLSATNRAYGRRFEIVRFRWLAPEEI
jgi:hypothetical protein